MQGPYMVLKVSVQTRGQVVSPPHVASLNNSSADFSASNRPPTCLSELKTGLIARLHQREAPSRTVKAQVSAACSIYEEDSKGWCHAAWRQPAAALHHASHLLFSSSFLCLFTVSSNSCTYSVQYGSRPLLLGC